MKTPRLVVAHAGVLLAFLLFAEAASARNSTGTWAVRLSTGPESLNTCTNKTANLALQILISENDGVAEANVIGKTDIPRLTGAREAEKLVLRAIPDGKVVLQEAWVLQLFNNDEAFKGTRLRFERNADGTSCVRAWDVFGTSP